MTTSHEIFRFDHIPPGIMRGLANYKTRGIPPGDCLYAILTGDLFGAVSRADADTAANLASIVCWIATQLPEGTWGNRADVERHIAWGRQEAIAADSELF